MSRRAASAALVAALLAAPFLLDDYRLSLSCYIGMNALVTLGLVLLTGVSGLTSFGQAAFVGLGAYASAVWTTSPAVPAALGAWPA